MAIDYFNAKNGFSVNIPAQTVIDGNRNFTGTTLLTTGSATASQLFSTVADGTAPLVVTSTTLVNNLNADAVDGRHVNDAGTSTNDLWTASQIMLYANSASGTVTSVTAGNGLTQSGVSTVNPTINVASVAGVAGVIGTVAISADGIGVNLGTSSTVAAAGDHSHTSFTDLSVGNLTVNGTTTTINTSTMTIYDPIITLGTRSGSGAATDDNKDRGIEFKWNSGSASATGFFGFDDSSGFFTFIPTATVVAEAYAGTLGDFKATNFRGNLIGQTISASAVGDTVSIYNDITTGSVSIANGTGLAGPVNIASGANGGTRNVYINANGGASSVATTHIGTNASGSTSANVNIGTLGKSLTTINGNLTLPALSGTSSGFLKSNASGVVSVDNTAYTTNTGTVTNIATSAGNVSGITLVGGPITTTGTISLGGSITGLTTSNLASNAAITNAQLANNFIAIGTTQYTLGASATSLSGLTSVAATTFTGTLSGTATNATNIGTTDDVASGGIVHPLWVAADSGNQAAKISTTKLTFTPSAGLLRADAYDIGTESTFESIAALYNQSTSAVLMVVPTTYRSAEFNIQAVEGSKYHTTKIIAINNGSIVQWTEFGTVMFAGTPALQSIDMDYVGGMRLIVIPSSTSSTTVKVTALMTKA